jgi:tetratricopeptide (TPR) repeat protein
LGQREEQQQDLQRLTELVTRIADKRPQAEVALRKASFALVTGNYDLAQLEAQRASTLAAQAGDSELETKAYDREGRILWQQGRSLEAEPLLQQALALARANHHRLDEAQCLFGLGTVRNYQGDFEHAQEYTHQAQEIYKELNHRQGEIRCLNLIGVISYSLGNYLASMSQYEHALALSWEIGWRYAETAILSNLGNSFFDLGCYDISRNYHEQTLAICHETGNKEMESVSLDTLGLIAHALGNYPLARASFEQALTIGREINNERSIGYILTHLGYTLAEEGHIEEAQATLDQALRLRRSLGNDTGAIDALGGLALIAVIGNEPHRALEYVHEVLTWIEKHGIDGLEFPIQLYLICYRVLHATWQDTPTRQIRAETVLSSGYALLQERASRIQDDELRLKFLENVPANREIRSAYDQSSTLVPSNARVGGAR